ncbi:hypothetical protein [Streptomyces sp. NPDC057336]|uniref:hypothetical protein n=1 Tax=Streptomyces sp. NPDC057336 TaxID=3346102 RepID=UPI003636D0A3
MDCDEDVHWSGPGAFGGFLIVCVPGVGNSAIEPAAHLARKHAVARREARLFPTPGG